MSRTYQTKLTQRQGGVDRPLPHHIYKAEFLARVMAFGPDSILDVGCGDGAFLAQAQAQGCSRCVGIEPGGAKTAAPVEIVDGRGELLPFPDSSFDAVILEYSAHHIEDLARALGEAARVARRAIHVLDPWYDVAIPSQQVARDYDLWLKRVDRRLGAVHNPALLPCDFIARLGVLGPFEIDISCRLVLAQLEPAAIATQARAHLAQAGRNRPLSDALDAILDEIALHGISSDGAMLFSAVRPGTPQ